MSVMSELNLLQREGAHSEFNAAKVVVATAATLVNDIFEQTGMHALKISIAMMPSQRRITAQRSLSTTACLPSKRSWTRQRAGRLRSWTCEPNTHCTAWSQLRERHTKATGASSDTPQTSPKIFQKMCDDTAKLRCGAVRALAPMVKWHEASRIPIVEFYSGFVSVSFGTAWASSEWTHLVRTSWRRALACGSWMLCPS